MYQKMSIHYSLVNGILIFLKLTTNTHFPPLFNCKAQIVICHVFFDRLIISWYTKDFSIESLPCMSKHNNEGKLFSKYMDKALPRCYVTNAFHLWRCFHTWNWHLGYISCHFSILANYHLPCGFFKTLRICWYTKKINQWKVFKHA
jgi:hypothetical protein